MKRQAEISEWLPGGFISRRERRGGIRDITDIDGFHGLAPGVRDNLRWSGRV